MKDGKFNGVNPAYPVATNDTIYAGLTKRELFAAMAMQAMLSNHDCVKGFEEISTESAEAADYLLAELERTK
jgi:hypothetical protein